MPEDIPDRMPDKIPEDMSEYMPKDMPDRMPDKMPENMSDRMPEDLPITKRIDVMVGITRSKVFFKFGWRHTSAFQGLWENFALYIGNLFHMQVWWDSSIHWLLQSSWLVTVSRLQVLTCYPSFGSHHVLL